MNNDALDRAQRAWENPPDDDIEQEYCEYCNQPMELQDSILWDKQWNCTNQFCPEKFSDKVTYTGDTLIKMAERLAEIEQELADAKSDLKYAKSRIDNLKLLLTRSQEGE